MTPFPQPTRTTLTLRIPGVGEAKQQLAMRLKLVGWAAGRLHKGVTVQLIGDIFSLQKRSESQVFEDGMLSVSQDW